MIVFFINNNSEFVKYKETNENWLNDVYFVNDEHFNKGGANLLADIVLGLEKIK